MVRSIGALAIVGLVAGAAGGGVVAATRAPSHRQSSPVDNAAVAGTAGLSASYVEAVARTVTPSVVLVQVQGGGTADEGSGIVLSKDGLILTNNHVIAAAAGHGQIDIVLSNGQTRSATIVGRDPVSDLAVLKATGATHLSPARIGNSAGLRVGQPVVAVGAPLGLQGTVTSGIVSALDRPVVSSGDNSAESSATDAIQTDAPINPGNSGGPLVDARGQVIGIDSSIATIGSSPFQTESGSIGLGFAIPIDQAMRVVHQIEDHVPVTHALLGVSLAGQASNTSGARVAGIQPGSPAARAGLRSGDVIIRFDGQVIDGPDALVAAVHAQSPGAKVALSWLHGDSTHSAVIRLGTARATT